MLNFSKKSDANLWNYSSQNVKRLIFFAQKYIFVCNKLTFSTNFQLLVEK